MSDADGGLRNIFRQRITGLEVHFQLVEMASIAQGVPDINYCIQGAEGWIENKQTHHWAVKFRPQQPGWIHKRVRAGGRVWIAVRRWQNGRPNGEYDELWLVPGRLAIVCATEGLQAVAAESYVCANGPHVWDWRRVRRIITS